MLANLRKRKKSKSNIAHSNIAQQGGGKMKEEIKVIPVIRVVCEIGNGSKESPCRTGIEYRDLDGKILFITESDIAENGEIISAKFRERREM